MKKTLTGFITLLAITMLCGGCIKENLADCNFNLSVEFVQQGGCGNGSLYTKLGKVTVFAFNDAGIFQDYFTTELTGSGSAYKLPVSLPRGNYTFVAWAGYSKTLFQIKRLIKGRTTLNELYMPTYGLGNGNKKSLITPIFTGVALHVNANDGNTQVIRLQEINKPLQINFEGLPAKHNYQARISFNAVRLKFENSLISLLADDHYTMASLDYMEAQKKYTAQSSLLWPMQRYTPKLIIRDLDTGTDVFNADVKAMLEQVPQLNFDCEPLIRVDLSMNENYPATLSIVVNGWKVQVSNDEI